MSSALKITQPNVSSWFLLVGSSSWLSIGRLKITEIGLLPCHLSLPVRRARAAGHGVYIFSFNINSEYSRQQTKLESRISRLSIHH
jgi:hypothetical protein